MIQLEIYKLTLGKIVFASFHQRRLFDIYADDSTSRFRKRQGPKKSALNVDDIVRLLQEKGTNLLSPVARKAPA